MQTDARKTKIYVEQGCLRLTNESGKASFIKMLNKAAYEAVPEFTVRAMLKVLGNLTFQNYITTGRDTFSAAEAHDAIDYDIGSKNYANGNSSYSKNRLQLTVMMEKPNQWFRKFKLPFEIIDRVGIEYRLNVLIVMGTKRKERLFTLTPDYKGYLINGPVAPTLIEEFLKNSCPLINARVIQKNNKLFVIMDNKRVYHIKDSLAQLNVYDGVNEVISLYDEMKYDQYFQNLLNYRSSEKAHKRLDHLEERSNEVIWVLVNLIVTEIAPKHAHSPEIMGDLQRLISVASKEDIERLSKKVCRIGIVEPDKTMEYILGDIVPFVYNTTNRISKEITGTTDIERQIQHILKVEKKRFQIDRKVSRIASDYFIDLLYGKGTT